MVLLIVFALIAGAATAISPCVLPVLPLALSAGVTGGRRRPLGVVCGLALSFTFATVALVYVISALGLPNGLLRTLAIATLIVFGLALIVAPLGARLEALLGRLAPRPAQRAGAGFGSGMVVGIGLGFVYAPCAGPILAGVITASASQSFMAGRLAVALAYGLGSAVTLYLLLLGGRRLTSRLARRSVRFQAVMGALMVAVALAMLGNYDLRFETAIASDLPAVLVNPTHSLETSASATRALAALRGHAARAAGGVRQAAAGEQLPVLGLAPEFVGTQRWFNTPGGRPLTIAGLRGHVVLIDFWTYSCINCIRTLPYLKAWDARYRSKGLVIVGVHTPEFPFEHSAANVAEAIRLNGLRYPVVQDNGYATWNAYGNAYWPAEYLIDGQGRVRLVDFGEGGYAVKERAIRQLLTDAGATGLGRPTHPRAEQPSNALVTPESYLGAARAERFTNGLITAGVHDYGSASSSPPHERLRYEGRWSIALDGATALDGARLQLDFLARRVFLVLGSPDHPRTLRVLLDGYPIPASLSGRDVHGAVATISFQRLYRLVDLPRVERHVLTIEPAPGITGYAFTFG